MSDWLLTGVSGLVNLTIFGVTTASKREDVLNADHDQGSTSFDFHWDTLLVGLLVLIFNSSKPFFLDLWLWQRRTVLLIWHQNSFSWWLTLTTAVHETWATELIPVLDHFLYWRSHRCGCLITGFGMWLYAAKLELPAMHRQERTWFKHVTGKANSLMWRVVCHACTTA